MKRHKSIATVPSSCEKIAFASKADGRRYIKKNRRANNRLSAKHVYKCPVGDHFHTTSQTAGARR